MTMTGSIIYVMQHIEKGDLVAVAFVRYRWKRSENRGKNPIRTFDPFPILKFNTSKNDFTYKVTLFDVLHCISCQILCYKLYSTSNIVKFISEMFVIFSFHVYNGYVYHFGAFLIP